MRSKVIAIFLLMISLNICTIYAEDNNLKCEQVTLNINNQNIDVNSYKIDNESYFMLRDIAKILNNTNKQINIIWDDNNKAVKILSNTKYVDNDNSTSNVKKKKNIIIKPSSIDLYLDENKIDITSYEIDGSNYIRLQDLMLLLDINLVYDENNNLTGLDTSLSYDKEKHIFTPSSNVKILLYHNFTENEPSKDQYYITVSKDKFENDMKVLLDNGFKPLSLENYYLNKYNKNKKYFVLTFDDGYLSNYDIAYPIIKKYNVYADIFINTDNIYLDHHFKLDQAKEMENSGLVKIYSHYPVHVDVRNIEATEYKNMLKKSLETLETVLDKKDFYFFAYPYGYYNEEKYNLANEAGFKLQAVQTITYKDKNLIKRYNITHKTNILKLVNDIAH